MKQPWFSTAVGWVGAVFLFENRKKQATSGSIRENWIDLINIAFVHSISFWKDLFFMYEKLTIIRG